MFDTKIYFFFYLMYWSMILTLLSLKSSHFLSFFKSWLLFSFKSISLDFLIYWGSLRITVFLRPCDGGRPVYEILTNLWFVLSEYLPFKYIMFEFYVYPKGEKTPFGENVSNYSSLGKALFTFLKFKCVLGSSKDLMGSICL